jgi:hypothetical protein
MLLSPPCCSALHAAVPAKNGLLQPTNPRPLGGFDGVNCCAVLQVQAAAGASRGALPYPAPAAHPTLQQVCTAEERPEGWVILLLYASEASMECMVYVWCMYGVCAALAGLYIPPAMV